MTLGFAGTGRMGLPIARNLIRSGMPLLVWNRTPDRCAPLVELGATQVASIDALCEQATVVMLMLLNEAALDAALGRGTPAFRTRVRGTTFVQLGTTSAAYSLALERDIRHGGGHYVEAPVSGSRVPAEQGRLVGMVAGEPGRVATVLPLLEPICSQVFPCGPVPGALRMKLAVNHYLIAMATALAEAVHAARSAGLDVALLRFSMPGRWPATFPAPSWKSWSRKTIPRKRRSATSAPSPCWSPSRRRSRRLTPRSSKPA
jgi:3-hydroxyisobutyrate dehydrogenase